jgi:nucleotide-binding universal stress UspA family protein
MQNKTTKFGTIVVATDLSGVSSSVALRYAQAIARIHESRLVVMHAIDPVGYAFPEGAPEFAAADCAAREELRKIEEETRREGIPVHSAIETGVVYQQILQAVLDHHAELLVLGTRAKTGIGRAALGKVARQVLAKVECPVLTVSPDAEADLALAGRWRNVLVATDFSSASLSALRSAHRIAHGQLVALHVPLCKDGRECKNCLERLRFLVPFNESHTVPVEHIVQSGNAEALIVEYARLFGVDLVVLGSPENELAEEDFDSSTVLQVISQVECPVLCVPANNRAEHVVEVIREVCYGG